MATKRKNTDAAEEKPAKQRGRKPTATEPAKVERRGGKRERKDLENFGHERAEPGDNARYLRHALAVFDLPPIDISDPVQVEERIRWYFNYCIDSDMKPTVNGLCNAIGINKQTFWEWGHGVTRSKTHGGLVKKAYALLNELWEDYMLNGKVNPASGIFLGKNHFGYKDVQEIQVAAQNPLGEMQDEAELRQRITDSIVVEADETEDF